MKLKGRLQAVLLKKITRMDNLHATRETKSRTFVTSEQPVTECLLSRARQGMKEMIKLIKMFHWLE